MDSEKFAPSDVMALLNVKGMILENYRSLIIGGFDQEEARALTLGSTPRELQLVVALWLDREDASHAAP